MDIQKCTSPCARCGCWCVIAAPQPRIDYPIVALAPATNSRGMCAECAAHWWLLSVDGIRWAVAEGGTWVLEQVAIQEALGRLLGKMHVELGALDWGRLLRQWELPWPNDWRLPCDRVGP